MISILKHLPGKHDQKLHAPKKVAPSGGYQIKLNPRLQEGARKRQLEDYSQEELDRATPHFAAFVKDAPVCTNVTSDTMLKILSDGEFKNQHQTGTSSIAYAPEFRAEAERLMFDPEWSKPSDYPFYGYLDTTAAGMTPSIDEAYGSVKVVFNDAIKARTTVILSDSMDSVPDWVAAPTPLLNPTSVALGYGAGTFVNGYNPRDGWDFVEAQIHGGLKVSDISHVYIAGADYQKLGSQLSKRGIAFTVKE